MIKYEDAEDEYITVKDVKFAYRRLGLSHGIPLVFLMHFRGTMDHWDFNLLNPLAAQRPILLLDNAGVGRSTGQIPTTFNGWAQHVVDLLAALRLPRVDLLGFSMGGCVAQLVALHPSRPVRRLILAGTSPSTGPGVRRNTSRAELAPFARLAGAHDEAAHRAAFLETFFAPTPRSQAAGAAAWERIRDGRPGRTRTGYVAPKLAKRQGMAFAGFMDPARTAEASFGRLGEIEVPVLIAGGKEDLLLPTENNVVMYQRMPQAQLHLYPDSGHGFLYQYAEDFAALINGFLNAAGEEGEDKVGSKL